MDSSVGANLKFERRTRLINQAQFGHVFARPTIVQDHCFRVLARANELSYSRLGMAVSIKISKLAVERNRIKRVVRESFRHHRDELATGGGIDLVILPGRHAASICNEKLRKSLAKHWQKLVASMNSPDNRHSGPNKELRN